MRNSEMAKLERANFGSKLGVILATAGSAVEQAALSDWVTCGASLIWQVKMEALFSLSYTSLVCYYWASLA